MIRGTSVFFHLVHLILSMEIFTIKHYITEVEKQNRFYEKTCTKSLDIYDRRMYIDNFQFADLKQNTVPYIAVMHFGALAAPFFVPKTVGKYKRLDVGHQ